MSLSKSSSSLITTLISGGGGGGDSKERMNALDYSEFFIKWPCAVLSCIFFVESCNDQGVCDLVKCQHGGQCLVQKDENPTCLCPLGFSGPFCETPLDLQVNVVLLYVS